MVMAETRQFADRISGLLARTRQHPYEDAVVAETAALISALGESWVRLPASPVGLAELPPSIAGCVLAYAAALQEDGRPELTLLRLEREAMRHRTDRDYHLARAAELARMAQAADPAYRAGLSGQAVAHAECARRDEAAAAAKRTAIVELGSPRAEAA
jgi:hypothetical protein